MTHANTTVAVLGLGAMGSRMAQRLLDAGFRVVVHNRTPARVQPLISAGAAGAESPRAAVRSAHVVLSMVTDDDAARDVWLHPGRGALGGLSADTVVLECSTVSAPWVRELSTAVTGAGATMLECPVVGTRPQADAGTLVSLVGGDPHALERARPVLEAYSSAVHHVGPTGHGALLKLIVNGLFAAQTAAMAETIALLRASGLDLDRALNVLGQTAVASPAMKGVGALMVARKFAPMFPIDLVAKDLCLLREAYRTLTVPARTAGNTSAIYEAAREAGHGSDNITGVAQLWPTA